MRRSIPITLAITGLAVLGVASTAVPANASAPEQEPTSLVLHDASSDSYLGFLWFGAAPAPSTSIEQASWYAGDYEFPAVGTTGPIIAHTGYGDLCAASGTTLGQSVVGERVCSSTDPAQRWTLDAQGHIGQAGRQLGLADVNFAGETGGPSGAKKLALVDGESPLTLAH